MKQSFIQHGSCWKILPALKMCVCVATSGFSVGWQGADTYGKVAPPPVRWLSEGRWCKTESKRHTCKS